MKLNSQNNNNNSNKLEINYIFFWKIKSKLTFG